MQADNHGVLLGSETVPYADGSEDRILEILLAARDRSDGSDELAAHITDWPTKYHLSPMRSNVLRPLDIRATDRVLEIGAGTGVLTRWLAEHGCRVTAVEGSLERAHSIAVRCRGLDNVTVIAGTLADVPPAERFDVVVVVGVLEHVVAVAEQGALGFLQECADFLADDGALALAIENQLGLKYLIGYDEDHHGFPWIGLEDYPRGGARTWSRKTLASLLVSAGLAAQRWLYPFPDYKLPSAVVSDSLYEDRSAADIIDLFIRRPASDEAGRRVVCDDRAAHRTMVDAGIGPDVANSFLVVAGRTDGAVNGRVGAELLWYFGTARLAPWRRERTVVRAEDGSLTLLARRNASTTTVGWLTQRETAISPVVLGRPLDRLLDAALTAGEIATARSLLEAWVANLAADDGSPLDRHPYSPDVDDEALARDCLDVSPSNFVLGPDGWTFVDAEWLAAGSVSRRLAITRALWYYAVDFISTAAATPWGPTTTVDMLTCQLAGLAGVSVSGSTLAAFREAEGELQQIVTGQLPHLSEQYLVDTGRLRPIDVIARGLPVGHLELQFEKAQAANRALAKELEHAQALYEAARDELRRTLGERDEE